ncbi:MAG: ABC transporter permease [Acidimicrobiales bacterium]
MLRVTLRSFWEHKRRMVSTVVAIVLGVAFMSGTFVLSDTLDRVFDDLFAESSDEVDAQVQGDVLFSDPFAGDQRATLDESLVADVAEVDGVVAAEPFVTVIGFGSINRVLDADGEPVGSSTGPPTLLENWIDDERLTPYVLTDGRGPEADDEIALNLGAVEDADFELGDPITVVGQFGPEEYELVGVFTFGTAKSAAGAVSAEFTLPAVQRLAGLDGEIQNVFAAGEDGVGEEDLVERIAPVLPEDAEVITGTEAAAQLSSDVQSGFAFFRQALTIFAGIALLVGAFVISNTFAILVAQRTRELALLRAVGASRGQVMGSVMLEAVLVGLVAAVLGLGAGVLLATGVIALLDAVGADLPTTSLVVRGVTVAAALVVGLIVTLIAASVPAIRATRVPPLAALRDVAVDRAAASRSRLILGIVALLVAALCLSTAWTSDGDSDSLATVGLGAVLAILGAIVIGPVLAGISIRALGSGLPRLKGITGRLATENAARSPKRTSATASALIIGVALVGFITVFAASAKSSVTTQVNSGFSGDFVVQSDGGGFGFSGFPTTVAEAVASVEGVAVVAPLGFGSAQITYQDGGTATEFLTSIDADTLDQVLDPKMVEGELTDLTDTGVLVDRQRVADHDLAIGDTIMITVPGGNQLELEVEGISDDPNILGIFTLSRSTAAEVIPQFLDAQVYGTLTDGADADAVLADIDEAVSATPALEVLDRDGFVGSITQQITAFVNIIYGLLLLSIIIALIGIANTLSLSINERTRELGLLRAVGMTRRQLRSAIRWEAVLISTLGALVGLGLGLVLSAAVLKALESQGLSEFTVPVVTLAVMVVLAAVLGTLASIRPARRAAKLAILDAIATE